MGLYKRRKAVQQTVAEIIHDHMRGVKEMFPGETHLTLVIRSERFEKPLIFTNDSPEAAIKAIRDMTEGGAQPFKEGGASIATGSSIIVPGSTASN